MHKYSDYYYYYVLVQINNFCGHCSWHGVPALLLQLVQSNAFTGIIKISLAVPASKAVVLWSRHLLESFSSVMRMRLAGPTHFVERGLSWKKRFGDHGMATPLVVATGHYQSHRDKNTVYEQKFRNC